MDDSNPDRLNVAIEFFILKRLSDKGSMTESEIQRRVKSIYILLDSLARRTGKRSLDPLSAVLRRLQLDGWLAAGMSGDDLVYSLTIRGEQRVQAESVRLNQMLSGFLDDQMMDHSFRKFLNERGYTDL